MATRQEQFTGHAVSVRDIERELSRLRAASAMQNEVPDLRTSVMTHIAWVPEDWLDAARQTLAGLAERHPSRTIILVPHPERDEALDAEVSLRCFRSSGAEREVCSEVIELHLGGRRSAAPASVVMPLLISDLPVFCRWRGQPPFGAEELEQLIGIVDRLVVDSAEWAPLWDGLHEAYTELTHLFDRVTVSDIAWSRTAEWRRRLAERWPEIARIRKLRVRGPGAEALLIALWLQTRLRRRIALDHDERDDLQAIEVDGEPVEPPAVEGRSASDLLSDELERFARDRIYEEAVAAAA